jgi:ParB family chromosome partitioning protein
MVERRLGRGLDFFLSGSSAADADPSAGEGVTMLDVNTLLPNPHQPRREFSAQELEDLAASIRSAGILQPILVRRVGDRHQIVAGERRWRAARTAGLERVPALVREISDEQAAIFGLVENLHREDLNPIEKARAFKKVQELCEGNQEEVGRQVGLDRSTIANFLRLLELPAEVQAYVSRGTLSMGQARALLGLPDETERKRVAEKVIRERMSVRQVEALVQELKSVTPRPEDQQPGAKAASPRERPLWLREIEDNLAEALDARVAVRYGRKRSKITIECEGREQFERLYELLKHARGES